MAAPDPPALEDVYDEDILARIDRVTAAPPAPAPAQPDPAADVGAAGIDDRSAGDDIAADAVALPRYPAVRRRLGGAVLAGAMIGVGEVLEPERARQHVIEFAPDRLDEDEQLVTFHLVPGSPRASRIVVRPWLLERFRRSRA